MKYRSLTLPVAMALVGTTYARMSQLGCFSDPGSLKNQGTYVFQSIGSCAQECQKKDASFAALHNGDECWCGSSKPSQDDSVSDNQCGLSCPGYPIDHCGGREAWAVYAVGDSASTTGAADESAGTFTLPTVTFDTATGSGSQTTSTPLIGSSGGAPTPTLTDTVIDVSTLPPSSTTPGVTTTPFGGSANRGPRILFF